LTPMMSAIAMLWYLEQLHDVLLVVLDAAGMPETRESLVKAWDGFTSSPKRLLHTDNDDRFASSSSPALTFLERLIDGIRMSASAELSSEEAWTLNTLESMLEDTATLVRGRGVRPGKEGDVQKVMHDYISATFPDFRLNPPIGGSIKTFKPDCGVASVGAAVEFKIVFKKEEVAKAFSGIAEDSAGYKGSKDWTRFYAVIYQAQPFASKSRFRSDMKRIGATTWKTILVNGPTRKSRKKRATKKASTKKKRVRR